MIMAILMIKEIQSVGLWCIVGIVSSKSQILLKTKTDAINKITSDNNNFFFIIFFFYLSRFLLI